MIKGINYYNQTDHGSVRLTAQCSASLMSPSYVYLHTLYRPKHLDIKPKISICFNLLILIKDVNVKKEKEKEKININKVFF